MIPQRACATPLLLLAVAATALSQDVTVADFENAAHAALFAKETYPVAAISTERASQGERALKLSFEQYQPGNPQWPMVSFDPKSAGAPTDWSGSAQLLLDVYTQQHGAILRVLVNDGDAEWYTRVPVPAGEWQTLRFALSAIGASVDLSRVNRVGLYMTRPEAQTTFFVDNIRLAPWHVADPAAVEVILVRPAFNRGFYHSNPEWDVTVRVTVKAPSQHREGLVVGLSLHKASGKVIGEAISRECTSRQQMLTLPKPRMRDGDRITARFELKRGDETLRKVEFPIAQRSPANDEVVLRDDGVTLVNGEPFFPFGMYQSPVSEFPTLKRMGFNTVHTYVPADGKYMKAAQDAGLRVISAVKGTYAVPPHYHEPKWREDDVAAYVKTIMHSPALLAYYMYDEPSPGLTPNARLRELCDVPRRIDPYHLSVGCNNGHQYAYRGVADAMMVDSYPVPGPMKNLIERTREGAKAQEPNAALWFIPQAFSWEPYFRAWCDAKGNEARRPGRTPTFDEVRTMPWISIAIGARGLTYYSWRTQGFCVRDAYPVFWRGFEHHVNEVVALFPWLLEREPREPVQCTDPAVSITARQRGDDLFVAAANSSLKPTQATITIPKLAGRRLHAVSEDRAVQPDGDSIDVSLAAIETRIFTTSLAGLPKLPTLKAVREEQARLAAEFAEDNPSICTVREGATMEASWGFPRAPAVQWASWYRMIDGYPGTPWVIGQAFRSHALKGWKDKDFASPGRWIEVRFPKPHRINMLRAIVSPWTEIDLQVPNGDTWRTVEGNRVIDSLTRHHSRPSATTTAKFPALHAEGFRVVLPKRRDRAEVVFELSGAMTD